MSKPEKVPLSVVLISRNQRWNIKRLISSVQAETRDHSAEILLVDSASTDGTPELAAEHGIDVIRLRNEIQLTPSAGRFVGYHLTSGKFILFLDGDAELVGGWLHTGLELLSRHSDVACVTGTRVTLAIDTQPQDRPGLGPTSDVAQDVRRVGGSGLYRRSALATSGPFDPYLYSEEEPELALRLRHHGFRLLRTQSPIIFDYSDNPDETRTVLARRRRRLYVGTGQVLRKHLRQPTFWEYAAERWTTLAALLAVISWVGVTAVSIALRNEVLMAVSAATPTLLAVGVFIGRRTVRGSVLFLVRVYCHVEGTLRGLLLSPKTPSAYPMLYSRIRR